MLQGIIVADNLVYSHKSWCHDHCTCRNWSRIKGDYCDSHPKSMFNRKMYVHVAIMFHSLEDVSVQINPWNNYSLIALQTYHGSISSHTNSAETRKAGCMFTRYQREIRISFGHLDGAFSLPDTGESKQCHMKQENHDLVCSESQAANTVYRIQHYKW